MAPYSAASQSSNRRWRPPYSARAPRQRRWNRWKKPCGAIDALAPALPEFLGGSADLTGSNLTNWKGCVPVREGKEGNYINYGVREFGMSAIMNGIVLHGGFIPFGGTFLTFSDYCRNAIRMSSLMQIGTIYVFTHDSIGVGEDGPTHQPIEQTASLRLIPGLENWRPCDTVETAVAWGNACLLYTSLQSDELPII